MLEWAVKKEISIFVSSIIGSITGFVLVTAAIMGIKLGMDLTGIYFADFGLYPGRVSFSESLGDSALLGTFGFISGFVTGVGVGSMGIRPFSKLIWPLIVWTGIVLGGWIGRGYWLGYSVSNTMKWLVNDFLPSFVQLIVAIAAWPIVLLLESILRKLLTKGRTTQWIIGGYLAAVGFMAFTTFGLLYILLRLIFH